MQISSKAERALARSLGLCTRCGSPLPETHPYLRCGRCTNSQQAANAARRTLRRARRDAGLCARCGAPSGERFQCRTCADLYNAYQRDHYRRRRGRARRD